MSLLVNLALLLGFAWVVRGLLAARDLTWPRTLVAVVVGGSVGAVVAGLLLIDPTELGPGATLDVDRDQLLALALPFQVVATMLVVLAMELVSSRPAREGPWRPRNPWRAVTRRLGITRRMLQVSRIASRHGLAPALGLRRGRVDTREPAELARRTRLALEEAGGMFVKLGQLLATRPDLLPPEALAELGRLHAGATALPTAEVRAAIDTALPDRIETTFTRFDDEPLGSASIAQVHAAVLPDGREVVCKVRRPGLEATVERDLAIVAWLADVAHRRTSWGPAYGVRELAADFSTALRGELDLRLEARNAQELAATLADETTTRVPEIVTSLSSETLLVMERLPGVPLSALPASVDAGTRRAMADQLCRSQVQAMLRGERFHADPHPGNVLRLPDGTLGLIDLGATGKLDAFERTAMLQLLAAIGMREPGLLVESLVAAGAVAPEQPPEELERALARFLAAHLDTGLPSADALTELLRLMLRLGIRLPPQSSTMFRALATLAGTLETLVPGYPLVDEVAEIGGLELRERVAPTSAGEFLQREWAQLGPLLRRAPRQLDRIATQLQHGGLTTRIRLFSDERDARVLERLVNRGVLTALALGVGLLSVLLLGGQGGPVFAGSEVRLLEVLGWLGLFASTVLMLRVLLAVLRSDAEP